MTVGAHRPQIPDRIDATSSASCERFKMVDVDEAVTKRPVDDTETDAADTATRPVVIETSLSSVRVTLVAVDLYAKDAALAIVLGVRFVWEQHPRVEFLQVLLPQPAQSLAMRRFELDARALKAVPRHARHPALDNLDREPIIQREYSQPSDIGVVRLSCRI